MYLGSCGSLVYPQSSTRSGTKGLDSVDQNNQIEHLFKAVDDLNRKLNRLSRRYIKEAMKLTRDSTKSLSISITSRVNNKRLSLNMLVINSKMSLKIWEIWVLMLE